MFAQNVSRIFLPSDVMNIDDECLLQLHVALDDMTMRPNACAFWNEGWLLN